MCFAGSPGIGFKHSVVLGNLPPAQRTAPQYCPENNTIIVGQCGREFFALLPDGFPWTASEDDGPHGSANSSRGTNDPLDSLNHACLVFDDFERCLDQHSFPDACLVGGAVSAFIPEVVFKYLCHMEKRDLSLFQALACLQKSPVLDLLQYKLADLYGRQVINQRLSGGLNAMFRFIDSESLLYNFSYRMGSMDLILDEGLICFPDHVILEYVPTVISTKCGDYSAHLVTNYYMYYR